MAIAGFNHVGETLWDIYQLELAADVTDLRWGEWLDQAAAYRPRLQRMALIVKFALADSRLYETVH